MESEQEVKKGEYRRLTHEEVGGLVRRLREQAGMKQITLASEARVHERTVQRIEKGEKADDETLRRVAKALHLDEKLFVEPLYVPSIQEFDLLVKRAQAEFTVIEAHDLKTLGDCGAILAHGHVFVFDDHLADQVAEFKDLVTDWGDVYNDISHAERLEACRTVLGAAENLGLEGHKILFGGYTTEDRWKWKVTVLLFVLADDGQSSKVAQLVVPRTLQGLRKGEAEGMVWEQPGGRVEVQTTDRGTTTTNTQKPNQRTHNAQTRNCRKLENVQDHRRGGGFYRED